MSAPLSFAARWFLGIGAPLAFVALLAGARSDAESRIASVGPAEAVAASAAPPASFYSAPFESRPSAAALTALGRVLFSETALSASGRMSCASCHDPAHAYGPPDARSVRLGGRDGTTAGVRAVPSLRYQQDALPFTEHFSETDGNDSVDQGPVGGKGWDGRASSAHEQAALPLLSSFEMANASPGAAVARLRASPSAARFRETFGPRVLDDAALAWTGLLWALEVFQQSPDDFYPYSSKYDAFLRGQATLDERERRGLELFDDPTKGNCANCHISAIRRGAFPQFTDRGLLALGVPRNRHIPANTGQAFYDLGLCGPLRTDFANRAEYCGLFKTPTLRNVALRRVFFHNGVYHRLDDVLAFYAERDVAPARFYPRDRTGRVAKFDDLPASCLANVNRDPPFGGSPGRRAALTARERADIVAFLGTLTDGWHAVPGAAARR
jgi:cytochrome c peroxidase